MFRATRKQRTIRFVCAHAASASSAEPSENSMLDWPEANQTSPTSTSRTTRSLISRSNGPSPTFRRSSRTSHVPSWPATPSARTVPSETRTASPGSALPKTGVSAALSKTAWSEKTAAGLTAADAAPHTPNTTASNAFRMVLSPSDWITG